MRSRAQKPPPQDPSRRALSMVHHSFSLYIGFHYKSNCSYLKEIETERFHCFIRVYFFDRLKIDPLRGSICFVRADVESVHRRGHDPALQGVEDRLGAVVKLKREGQDPRPSPTV